MSDEPTGAPDFFSIVIMVDATIFSPPPDLTKLQDDIAIHTENALDLEDGMTVWSVTCKIIPVVV